MKKCQYCGRRHEPIPHDKTMVLGYHEGRPIIKAVPDEQGLLTFYCQYCDREHLHGISDGHRVAHCTSDTSPFCHGGYYLNRTDDEIEKPVAVRAARKLMAEVG